MSCIYRQFDREGGYCSKKPCPRNNKICNGEYGCPGRTDNSPAFNSSTGKYEKFIEGVLTEV